MRGVKKILIIYLNKSPIFHRCFTGTVNLKKRLIIRYLTITEYNKSHTECMTYRAMYQNTPAKFIAMGKLVLGTLPLITFDLFAHTLHAWQSGNYFSVLYEILCNRILLLSVLSGCHPFLYVNPWPSLIYYRKQKVYLYFLSFLSTDMV